MLREIRHYFHISLGGKKQSLDKMLFHTQRNNLKINLCLIVHSLLESLDVSTSLYSVTSFQHHYGIPPHNYHTNIFLVTLFIKFNRFAKYQIHEWIEPAKGSLNLSSSIYSEMNSLIHEFLEFWGMSFGHD